MIPFFIVNMMLSFAIVVSSEGADADAAAILAITAYIFGGFGFWIALATCAKRWHDLDNSGWMTLWLLVPFVNFLFILFLAIAPGTAEANRYGGVAGKEDFDSGGYVADEAAFSLFRKASRLAAKGKFEAALSLYQEIVKTVPDTALARDAEISIQKLQEADQG
jgi:hypothetical protein